MDYRGDLVQPAGARNTRIEIQEINPDAVPDDSGRVDETSDGYWREYFTCWAEVVSQSGREFMQARQVQADLSAMLRVVANTRTKAIDTKMRIRLNGRTLGIIAAYNLGERNEVVEIQCKEAV